MILLPQPPELQDSRRVPSQLTCILHFAKALATTKYILACPWPTCALPLPCCRQSPANKHGRARAEREGQSCAPEALSVLSCRVGVSHQALF